MTDYNHKLFADVIGEKVEVVDGEGNSRELTVIDVKSSRFESESWQSHSIFLKGESTFYFTQGNYTVRHPKFEQHNLFLSPKSPIDYEAVISNTREENAQVHTRF